MMTGWSSPSIHLLTSKDSPLPTGTLTEDEASWTASLKSLGIVLCGSIAGLVANKFGRKWPMFLLIIPSIVRYIQLLPTLHILYKNKNNFR